MHSYRQSLNAIRFATLKRHASHAGLWFDKYLQQQVPKGDPLTSYQELVVQCSEINARIKENPNYKRIYDRWVATLDAMNVRPHIATVNGRLSLGLGNASVIETGITLHHTYGVPYIPGSGLKGVASAYAHKFLAGQWQKGGEAHETLFGTQESAGFVTFFDALPVPGEWELLPDVITVHHPKYYQNGTAVPADWDSPTPIPFLSISGNFLVALYAPDANAWTTPGYGIVRMALNDVGIGAKTSSGYGRMTLHQKPIPIPFTFKVGAFVRGEVTRVEGGEVILNLQPKFSEALPKDKDEYIYIPHDQVGAHTYYEGSIANCIITNIMEDEYDFIVQCRPETKDERQARA